MFKIKKNKYKRDRNINWLVFKFKLRFFFSISSFNLLNLGLRFHDCEFKRLIKAQKIHLDQQLLWIEAINLPFYLFKNFTLTF